MADKKKGPGASDSASNMADKKKGLGADSGSSPKPSKVSKIFDSLNKICCIAKDLKDDALGVEDLDKLLDNHKKLAEQLKAKDAQIANLTAEVESLKTAKSLLWDEFHEQCQELTIELDDLRGLKTELEKTRTKLKEAEEVASAVKKEHNKLRLGVERTAEYKKLADEQLQSTQEELEELRLRSAGVEVQYRDLYYLVGEDRLQDRNAIVLEDELEAWATRCHEKIFKAFLAIPTLTEQPPREILRATPQPMAPAMQPPTAGGAPLVARSLLDSIPLPCSTSKEAKLMRCAFVEHIFAKALVEHIFIDISKRQAPELPELQQAARTVLSYLGGRDERREAIVRSQLLTGSPEDDEGDMNWSIDQAFAYVRDRLDAVVPPGTPRDRYRLDAVVPPPTARDSAELVLVGLLREAATLWMPLRRSRTRISAELDVHWCRLVRADDCYRDYGDAEPGRHAYEVVVPLFPQIVKGQNILINPRVLWSDQAAVVSAREELKKERDRNGPKDKGVPHQQPRRRNSIRPSTVAQAQPPKFVTRRMTSDSMAGPPPFSGSKIQGPDRGGDGVAHGTGNGGSTAAKGAACAVSVMVELPEGGTDGSKGSAAAP